MPKPTPAALRLLVLPLLALSLTAQGLHIGPTEPETESKPRITPLAERTTGTTRPAPRRTSKAPRGREIYIDSLRIKARIVDGVASTELTQVFHNPTRREAEGIWILPLPKGATADHFSMTMNGRQVSGEVLDASKAQAVYMNIVRRRRDPGLLEYMGNGCLRARVYPIPARGEMKIEVRYRQVLPSIGGLHQWQFPLRAAHVNGRPARHLSLDLHIESSQPLENVYSPTADVDISRKDDRHARATFEIKGERVARRDLEVFYGLSEKALGLTLMTHRKKGEPGYFFMMLSPKLEWDESKTAPKCIQFVLDTSGSMSGQKILQARKALRFFVSSLKSTDSFNVIPFSSEARPFFEEPVAATPENVQKALQHTATLQASGGTNIDRALQTALVAKAPERTLAMTVFLTDGQPTVDTVAPAALLKKIREANVQKQRIFVFGVGNGVNTVLLDKIAAQSHGDRDYVREGETIEIKTGALFTKLSHPVMSGVRIDCDGVSGFDMYPKVTPDLFKGTKLILTGRYDGSGHHAIRVTGMVDGNRTTFTYDGDFPKERDEHAFIPTLWAQRKVAMLLDNIRLNGTNPELVKEIQRLGSVHGIVTQYSSHLILESDGVAAARGQARPRRARKVYMGPGNKRPPVASRGGPGSPRSAGPASGPRTGPRTPRGPVTPGPSAPGAVGPRTGPRTGGVAVAPPSPEDARVARELARAGVTSVDGKSRVTTGSDEFYMGSTKRLVDYSLALKRMAQGGQLGGHKGSRKTQHILGHTFHLIGGTWVDGKFTEKLAKRVQRVKAFSKEYFALIAKHQKLARIFAFSTRILIVIDDVVVEIV